MAEENKIIEMKKEIIQQAADSVLTKEIIDKSTEATIQKIIAERIKLKEEELAAKEELLRRKEEEFREFVKVTELGGKGYVKELMEDPEKMATARINRYLAPTGMQI